MEILNLIIAIVALVIAVLAFQRTGGIKDLRKSTAELLAKMEKKMREEEITNVELRAELQQRLEFENITALANDFSLVVEKQPQYFSKTT